MLRLTDVHKHGELLRRCLSGELQVDINRRRDAEMQKLQRDFEDSQSQNDAQLAMFRKKHQEAVNQLTEQMDQLHKVKQKCVDTVSLLHSCVTRDTINSYLFFLIFVAWQ